VNKPEHFLLLVQSALLTRYTRTKDYDDHHAMAYVLNKMHDAIYASEHLPDDLSAFRAAWTFLAFNFEDMRSIPESQLKPEDIPEWCQNWSEVFEQAKRKQPQD
jgi:hypothetical protein